MTQNDDNEDEERYEGDIEEQVAREVAGYERGDTPSNQRDPYQPEIKPERPEPDSIDVSDLMGGDSALAADDSSTPDQSPSSSQQENRRPADISALPTGQLDALSHNERRRYARKNGIEIPSTEDVRDRLSDTIIDVMRHEDERVIPGPTGSGKSYTIASTRWGARDDVTGGQGVVHLLPTRDARNEAAEVARDEGGSHAVLRSRDEACPVCAGEHDPEPNGENELQVVTIDGEPASEWMERMCNDHNIPTSDAHEWLGRNNDQDTDLPCMRDGACESIDQWRRIREDEPGLIIGTHNFAHVPGLRLGKNIVIDEEPSFTIDMSTARLKAAVTAFLQDANAMVDTWEDFWSVVTADSSKRRLAQLVSETGDISDDAQRKGLVLGEYLDSLWDDFETELNHYPDREWYYTTQAAHTAAPPVARAILNSEERAGDRRVGKTYYKPIRPDARLRDDDGYNREWLTIVFDSKNELSTIWSVPDFSQSRCVIGLDAHPSLPIWQHQTVPNIDTKPFLSQTERTLWRRYERGLRVIQVGDATRPLTSGEYFNWEKTAAVVEHLSDEYETDFRTALTTMSVEDKLENIMLDNGVPDPELMHYGEEKSRNDFANEDIGYVHGCLDPGDDAVMDMVAALDIDADPERADVCCKHCGDREDAPEEPGDGCHQCNHTGLARENGRNFVGEGSEKAEAILASVRENHVAQAAGRYARNADDPEDHATVFVATDAMPDGFADVKVPGAVKTFTSKQRDIVRTVRESDEPVSAHTAALEAGCTERYVRDVLNDMTERGLAEVAPTTGKHGRTLYADTGLTEKGIVELGHGPGPRNNDVQEVYSTWSFRVLEPTQQLRTYDSSDDSDDGDTNTSAETDGGGTGPSAT